MEHAGKKAGQCLASAPRAAESFFPGSSSDCALFSALHSSLRPSFLRTMWASLVTCVKSPILKSSSNCSSFLSLGAPAARSPPGRLLGGEGPCQPSSEGCSAEGSRARMMGRYWPECWDLGCRGLPLTLQDPSSGRGLLRLLRGPVSRAEGGLEVTSSFTATVPLKLAKDPHPGSVFSHLADKHPPTLTHTHTHTASLSQLQTPAPINILPASVLHLLAEDAPIPLTHTHPSSRCVLLSAYHLNQKYLRQEGVSMWEHSFQAHLRFQPGQGAWQRQQRKLGC